MILASHGILVEVLTELCFIAGRMVQLLNFVVRSLAVAVTFGTRNMAIVVEVGSSSILLVMVAQAGFSLMPIFIDTILPVRVHLFVLKV